MQDALARVRKNCGQGLVGARRDAAYRRVAPRVHEAQGAKAVEPCVCDAFHEGVGIRLREPLQARHILREGKALGTLGLEHALQAVGDVLAQGVTGTLGEPGYTVGVHEQPPRG